MLLGGCTSSTSGAPRAATSGPTQPSPAPSGTGTHVAGLCPEATALAHLTACLSAALATFWSGQLNTTVAEPVVLHPDRAKVPAPCRAGLEQAPAFTCPGNATLYFTHAFVTRLETAFPGAARSYAFAVVQAHEMGHVVQLNVHQPQIEDEHRTAADTRFVEQQADCLSGVWAHSAASSIGLDPAEFRTVAEQVLTGISTRHEIETHGTPQQRLAAIDRGLHGGRPQSCRLATFH